MGFHPYLNMSGNCREAFTRYHEIFGGELVLLGMDEMPGAEVPPGSEHLVIHAALKVGDALLLASDVVDAGTMQYVYVNRSVDDVDEARRVFDALADGGVIEVPMETTFFSPAFGVCKDRFGTPWMISADPERS